ncbi:MAG: hypothetical protein ACRECO_08620, partial [Xanthobacteraceae bacterium]
SLFAKVARRGWRLIPAPVRYRMAGGLRRAIERRESNQPLPRTVAMLRPLWCVLPRRIRSLLISRLDRF